MQCFKVLCKDSHLRLQYQTRLWVLDRNKMTDEKNIWRMCSITKILAIMDWGFGPKLECLFKSPENTMKYYLAIKVKYWHRYMGAPWEHYATWKKPVKGYILGDSIYIRDGECIRPMESSGWLCQATQAGLDIQSICTAG